MKLKPKRLTNLGFLLLIASVSLPSVRAQSGVNVALSGTVADPSGAMVPGATIGLRFVSSGAERKTMTGPDGRFLVLELTTGDYRISVEAQGFALKTSGSPIRAYPFG